MSQVTNPYCTAANPVVVYSTATQYDSLGRVVSVTLPGGAVEATLYNGNVITSTDPDGKVRDTTMDALGRITQVVEHPGSGTYVTTYDEYNPLDNLKKVSQSGQTRIFEYDSWGRLKARRIRRADAIRPPKDAI